MVRKQVYLTVDQNARLRRAAKHLQRSEAEVLRDALERFLPVAGGSGKTEKDALFRLVGVGSSGGGGNLSESVDDMLYGAGGA
jgi:hypothetical protein